MAARRHRGGVVDVPQDGELAAETARPVVRERLGDAIGVGIAGHLRADHQESRAPLLEPAEHALAERGVVLERRALHGRIEQELGAADVPGQKPVERLAARRRRLEGAQVVAVGEIVGDHALPGSFEPPAQRAPDEAGAAEHDVGHTRPRRSARAAHSMPAPSPARLRTWLRPPRRLSVVTGTSTTRKPRRRARTGISIS